MLKSLATVAIVLVALTVTAILDSTPTHSYTKFLYKYRRTPENQPN